MSNPFRQTNKRELIVPYGIEECAERIEALRLTRPSPHSHYHRVGIERLADNRVEFVVSSPTRKGTEQACLTGYLRPQGNDSTYVKMEANVTPLAKLALIGFLIYGFVAVVMGIYSPESIQVSVGFGLLFIIGALVASEFASSTRFFLIELVLEQLQESDPLKIPPDYDHVDPEL